MANFTSSAPPGSGIVFSTTTFKFSNFDLTHSSMEERFSVRRAQQHQLFQQRKQRPSFQNVLLTQTVAIATALSVNCLHVLLQSLTSLLLRPRLMNTKKCSFRDEIHRLLVPTVSPTLCGNVVSVFISCYILSFVVSGLQLTFHRLGNAPPSDSSTNLAQPVIHRTSDQLPCPTAREKFSSRLSVRQSCDTCS